MSVALRVDRRRLAAIAESSDVIHALTESLAPLAMMLSERHRTPYVVTAHGTFANLASYRSLSRWRYRQGFLRARTVVCVSNYTAAVVRSQVPTAVLEVIPGGFSPPSPTATGRSSSGQHRILSVGGLMRRKGFHSLLKAVSILRRQGLEVRCDIVGESPGPSLYPAQLRRLIDRLGLSDTITMLGRVSECELEALYAGAGLLALPSEHDGQRFEGLGLVYLEALSWGVPIIGSYESGAEDVIRNGENGLLIRPGDVPGLAAAIRLILEDNALRDSMVAVAPASAAHFRWDIVGSRLADLYRRCAAA